MGSSGHTIGCRPAQMVGVAASGHIRHRYLVVLCCTLLGAFRCARAAVWGLVCAWCRGPQRQGMGALLGLLVDLGRVSRGFILPTIET